MKTFNQEYLKYRNQSLILKMLKKKGPISRADLSKKIGIVRSTVSDIANKLIQQKIILEGKKVKGKLGKRPTLLCFNEDYYHYASVVITPERTDLAICDLNGGIIIDRSFKNLKNSSAKNILNLIFKNLDEMIASQNIQKLCLISLGSPETLNKNTGIIRWAPYIQDWIGLDLKEIFQKRYKTEVVVKEHVKLETLGEQWKNHGNISNMVYMVITRGIGAGIVIDGKIREGKNGYLGEIAFLPISEKIDYEKLKGKNKNLGFFESNCDINKIEEITKDYLGKKNKGEKASIKLEISNFSNIVKLYAEDKVFRKLIFEKIIKTLALGIGTIIVMLDPEIVIINGEIIEFGDGFLEILKKEIYSIIPYKREIIFSTLKNKCGIYGAVKNGLDHIEKYIFNETEDFYKFYSINIS